MEEEHLLPWPEYDGLYDLPRAERFYRLYCSSHKKGWVDNAAWQDFDRELLEDEREVLHLGQIAVKPESGLDEVRAAVQATIRLFEALRFGTVVRSKGEPEFPLIMRLIGHDEAKFMQPLIEQTKR